MTRAAVYAACVLAMPVAATAAVPLFCAQAERGDRAQLAPGAHVYTDAEQSALEADVSQLEDAAKRQRKRARTLMRLHNLYARRVPEAEEADARLGELLAQFKRRCEGACAANSPNGETHGGLGGGRPAPVRPR